MNAVGWCCTTRFSNAHRTVCRELLYRLHPWFECDVFVHSAIDKADGGVFRCTLDGSEAGRWLEIPAWMFDRAACVTDVRSLTDPFVSLEALGALSALLDQVLKTDAPSSNARLRDAYGISRDQNWGETHGREDGVSDWDWRKRRLVSQQMDMFASRVVPGAPDWPDLPRDAQEALLGLMTRLILEHARATAAPTMAGGGHDR